MLSIVVSVLLVSGLTFLLLDLVRYDVEDMWRPFNWEVTVAIIPFVVSVNAVLFVWYLLEGQSIEYAYEATYAGMWTDLKDVFKAGW